MLNLPTDTVTREETDEGGSIFTFRIVVTQAQMRQVRWLHLHVQDRLQDLIVDMESELIIEAEKEA